MMAQILYAYVTTIHPNTQEAKSMRQVIYGYIHRAINQIARVTITWLLARTCLAHEQTNPTIPMPAAKIIRADLLSAKLHTIDFMQVKNCALKATILKNQTRIAQYATASQQLLLDLEYLRLAPECIIQLKNQGIDTLANTLESARRLIKRQLPGRIFNATLAAGQYRKVWLFDRSEKDYVQAPESPLIALRDINQTVQAWLLGNYTANNLQLEIQLSEVAKARVYYGRWHAQQLTEIMQLEALLQKAVPKPYQDWQCERQGMQQQGNHRSNTLSN
jgi:hypothetical protein